MSGQPKHDLLARDIAAALGSNSIGRPASRALLLTGIALACMQPGNADALTLGDLKIESSLGQPLVSTTTARISPGESLGAACINSIAHPEGGLQSPETLKVTVAETSTPGVYPVRITSQRPLYEPMYEIRLQVNCPGNIVLTRSYVIMLNMPMTSPLTQPTNNELRPATQTTKSETQPNAAKPTTLTNPSKSASPPDKRVTRPKLDSTSVTAAQRPYTERFPTPMEPITADTDYRVQEGDTLSTIAQRVLGRPVGSTWEVAAVIQQINPGAFISNDPDLVKLGSVLRIPAIEELLGQNPVASRPTPVAVINAPIIAPVVEQFVDTPVENSVTPLVNEIVLEQSQIEFEPPQESSIASAAVTPDEARAVVQETPVPRPALISNNAQSSASEFEILIDRSLLETLQDPQVIVPIADSEIRKLEEFIPNTVAVKADTAPVRDATPVKVHPLLAVGLGLLLGCILAALMLGRRLLTAVRSVRADQPRTDAQHNENLPTNLSATASLKEPDFGVDTDVVEGHPEVIEHTDTADVGTRTNIGEAAVISLDAEVSANHNPGAEFDKETNNTSRVSLYDNDSTLTEETPLEKTERFMGPDFSSAGIEPESGVSELKDTATMRKLFSDEVKSRRDEASQADDDFSVTKELPDLGNASELEATSDLQSLADNVVSDDPNDKFSATLNQALGLLEQDYEDEYSESQILERREIQEAFAEHSTKKS